MSAPACIFCEIVAGTAPATIVRERPMALVIVPLNPVAPGHLLVVPRVHVADALVDPLVTAVMMAEAARTAVDTRPCNIITSAGAAATQTVFHLHIHIVPRTEGDGLALPWTTAT